MRRLLFVLLWLSMSTYANSQQVYSINTQLTPRAIKMGHLKMGNAGKPGTEILVNNQYMTIGGKPVVPVMGEMHFSRYPREQWEDAILKMKAGGITVVACYIFWNHHEEIEGQFEWAGNKDFRSFVKLCQKHNLLVYPRLGPWCHGEVRNGATPDWILLKSYIKDRSNHPVYQQYVDRWFRQMANQMQGLYYKDGGPIIGVQLENEYAQGKAGEDHILWLKKTALKYGIDVPLYTVTGWGNTSVPQDEVIPLWGAYPEAPWDSNIERQPTNESFAFYAPMNAENIGNDLAKKDGSYFVDYTRYPFFTCELGLGNQITYQRRPIIDKMDGLGLMLNRVATGSNLVGYYVFTGGSNPVGVLTSMEENKDETGYWCELPDISYDFQTAIKETGELAPSYHKVKKVHYFLQEFGDRLAPMQPVLYPSKESAKDLQLSVRTKDNQGFVFGLNYYRGVRKPEQKNCQLKLKLKNESLTFPSQPVNIPDSCSFIWPFNLDLDGVNLTYATAQPLCFLNDSENPTWVFIQNATIKPEFCLDAANIEKPSVTTGKIELKGTRYVISDVEPGLQSMIQFTTKSGKKQSILILTDQQSEHAWLLSLKKEKRLFISTSNLYTNDSVLHVFGKSAEMNVWIYGEKNGSGLFTTRGETSKIGNFTQYKFSVPSRTVPVNVQPVGLFQNLDWLKVSVADVNPQNQLNHKIFFKEFNLGNPSAVKSATLSIYADVAGKIQFNNRWVNQTLTPKKIIQMDVTGYVTKGENTIMMDFPFVNGEAGVVAKLSVEYVNTDLVEIPTDRSWQTLESYTIPSAYTRPGSLRAPEIMEGKKAEDTAFHPLFSEWDLKLPQGYLEGLNNLFVYMDYTGDIGRCRLNHHLVYDNFNNGTPWQMELKRFGNQLEGQKLRFQLYPLKQEYKILFDKVPSKEEINAAGIKNIRFVPEYSLDLNLNEIKNN